MSGTQGELQRAVDPGRVHDLALELVRIPSPTGDTRAVTTCYAERLGELGVEVQLDDEFPESPSVIAYVDGGRPGPTLELAGHLDTIPVPDDPPAIRDGVLYGRGACDMKGSLAAVTEVVRVLYPLRARLQGRLMVCAYGYHEAPLGRAQSLLGLLARGIVGDAVICVEGPADAVAVIGKGMSTFEITVAREGEPLHELQAPPDLPHPLLAGLDVAGALRSWAQELSHGENLPYIGPESLFLGQFECGDFYNRVPTRCRIVGTRRYAPHKRFDEVEAEFQGRLEPLRRSTGAEIRLDLVKAKDGFQVREDEAVVRALQVGYGEVTGRDLPAGGATFVADASNFCHEGGVPAVYHGCGLERAHATPEYVPLVRLEQLARVLLAACAHYLGVR
jgi:acetylornithine deacetylase/succinyl-diaminopimelate desuccinylase-like protein